MSLYFFWHSLSSHKGSFIFMLLYAAPVGASLSMSMCTLYQWWLWNDMPLTSLVGYVLTRTVLCEYTFIADMNLATNAIAQIIMTMQKWAIRHPHKWITFDHACSSNVDAMLCASKPGHMTPSNRSLNWWVILIIMICLLTLGFCKLLASLHYALPKTG